MLCVCVFYFGDTERLKATAQLAPLELRPVGRPFTQSKEYLLAVSVTLSVGFNALSSRLHQGKIGVTCVSSRCHGIGPTHQL